LSKRLHGCKIFKAFKSGTASSLRKIADSIDSSKSSVHRYKQQKDLRVEVVGHDFYETKEGIESLNRLFICVIVIFGLQAGVGSETISQFFAEFLQGQYIAHSPSYIRKMKASLRSKIAAYGQTQMEKVKRFLSKIKMHLGGDEMFKFGRVLLLLKDLKSNFILYEEPAKDRKKETWLNHVGDFLTTYRAQISSFVADGGSALKALADKAGVIVKIDLFHGMKDIKAALSTRFNSKLKRLIKEEKDVENDAELTPDDKLSKLQVIESKKNTVINAQKVYRQVMFDIATGVHPYNSNHDEVISKDITNLLTDNLSTLRSVALNAEIEDKQNLLDRFERRIDGMSLGNDQWFNLVSEELEQSGENDDFKDWFKHRLLPYVYWRWQYGKSKRDKNKSTHYKMLEEQLKSTLDADSRTDEYLDSDVLSWAEGLVRSYQRTTSAIEGRNGVVSLYCAKHRGFNDSHINCFTVIHNFWIKRRDGTTACQRLCGYKPPSLIDYLLDTSPEVAFPRVRNKPQTLAA
jgi:hypothetical protein